MPQWYFLHQRPGDTTREPIQGEFFSTEAISNTAEALVREGNQNSLDAGRESEKIRVRLFLSGADDATASAEAVKPYLTDAWPHFQAKQNGLRDIPAETEKCPYLVFEDFGTTGLSGNPLQWHKQEGVKNGFFTFFRAEGQSDKEQGDRGRWGVGKFVFPRSSRVSSFWAVTVRQEPKPRLMMGRAILKSHALGDQRFVPDGYFGEAQELEGGDRIIAPIEDTETIDAFCATFRLARENEPGLSIVVPWYDPEITQSALMRAVIEDYFFPILGGDLEVTVEGPDGKRVLTATTLVAEVEKLNGDLAAGMVPLIHLAAWARGLKPEEFVQLNQVSEKGPPKWTAALIPEAAVSGRREKFQKGERIALRVPFLVRPRDGVKTWSYFDVVIERDGTEHRERPVYIREGLIVSNVRPYRNSPGMRALVIAEHGPLATLLGDSENPAHTEWQRRSKNFENKYEHGDSNLGFVINSVSEIIRFITEADKEADKKILVDVFSLPAEPDDPDAITTKVKKTQGQKPDKKTLPPPPPPPPAALKRFRVEKVQGGFRIQPGDAEAPLPKRFDIRVAYEIRAGNPLRKYHPADFELDKSPISVTPKGMTLTFRPGDDKPGNEIEAEVTDRDFLLTVTGFDENRDVFVKVTVPQEDADGDQAA
jgi:hypothetical protein